MSAISIDLKEALSTRLSALSAAIDGAEVVGTTTSQTISIAASGDDGYVQQTSLTYPPSSSATVNTTGISIPVELGWSGTTFLQRVIILRFDTSGIPDTATVTGATLRMVSRSSEKFDADNRSLLINWHDVGASIDSTDYVAPETDTGTAYSADITGIAAANADVDFALIDAAANINKIGYTGLRLSVSGGQPAGRNGLGFAAIDHTTQAEPRLIVTYTTTPSGGGA